MVAPSAQSVAASATTVARPTAETLPFEHRLQPEPLADLLRHRRGSCGEPVASHHLQRAADPLVGHDVEERRLRRGGPSPPGAACRRSPDRWCRWRCCSTSTVLRCDRAEASGHQPRARPVSADRRGHDRQRAAAAPAATSVRRDCSRGGRRPRSAAGAARAADPRAAPPPSDSGCSGSFSSAADNDSARPRRQRRFDLAGVRQAAGRQSPRPSATACRRGTPARRSPSRRARRRSRRCRCDDRPAGRRAARASDRSGSPRTSASGGAAAAAEAGRRRAVGIARRGRCRRTRGAHQPRARAA